jgi:hypothetical protein
VSSRHRPLLATVIALLSCLAPSSALAHVGSPDVYFDGFAGPYHLLVTVQPPHVIPGVAEVQIRILSSDVNQMKIVPMRIVGPGADLAPLPDIAQRSETDPQFFAGRLWLMMRGSWKLRIQVSGSKGDAELSVPVPAIAERALPMQRALGGLLAFLALFLSAGLVTIIAVAARDARLQPCETPHSATRRRATIAALLGMVLVAALLYFGYGWWAAVAQQNAITVYKLPRLDASVQQQKLLLRLQNPNNRRWAEPVRLDDLIPDHGHLMHLFLVRQGAMDVFLHLHPTQQEPGNFTVDLPTVPAGKYQIFADIVHQTGFPETQVGKIEIPAIDGVLPSGDDSLAFSPPLTASSFSDRSSLPDSYRMVWEKDSTPPKAGQLEWLRFRVEDKDGAPAKDLEPYMGMAAHAAILSADESVFVHLHPAGSVSMAAVALASGGGEETAQMPMPMSHTGRELASSEVSFPYGFPKPGTYRMFVQVKRSGRIDTGIFDVQVSP